MNGYSLLETLLSVAISISLSLIIIYSYVTVRRIYQVNVNMNRMQNVAYFAQQLLAHDIRTAGFIGCIKLSSNVNIQHPSDIDLTTNNSLHGYASNQLPADMKSIAKVVVPGTDLIVIEKMSDQLMPLTTIVKHSIYMNNELIIISDCNKAKIVRYPGDSVITSEINKQDNFSSLAQTAPLVKVVYYISDTTRKTLKGEPILALYRKNLWGIKNEQTEIIDGIENMQIRYGIKSNTSKQINYSPATQITDWTNIVAVKIYLLLISMADVNYIKQPYQFMGEKLIASDQRMRREWVVITALRER